jgi:hypothetical protein
MMAGHVPRVAYQDRHAICRRVTTVNPPGPAWFAAWMREDDARRARTMAAGKRRTAELRLALIGRRMGPASRIDNFAAPRQAAATPGRPEHHG